MGLTGCPAGLLINFNVAKLIDGVQRLISTRRSPRFAAWMRPMPDSPSERENTPACESSVGRYR